MRNLFSKDGPQQAAERLVTEALDDARRHIRARKKTANAIWLARKLNQLAVSILSPALAVLVKWFAE